jgi:hypothetical protein
MAQLTRGIGVKWIVKDHQGFWYILSKPPDNIYRFQVSVARFQPRRWPKKTAGLIEKETL